MIPRLCKGLFEAISALGTEKDVTVVASYVEVWAAGGTTVRAKPGDTGRPIFRSLTLVVITTGICGNVDHPFFCEAMRGTKRLCLKRCSLPHERMNARMT